MNLLGLLFSFRGRLARLPFCAAASLVLVLFMVLLVFVESVAGRSLTLVLYPPLYAALIALAAKRLHDRERSAAWLLVALIPVLGPLWLFFELCFHKGSRGPNRYGPDPLAEDRDYLTVQFQ